MIIFLYGEDDFRSSQKIFEVRDKYLSFDFSGSGISIFDFSEEKNLLPKIRSVFFTANLLVSKRLLIIKKFIEMGSSLEQKDLLQFIKKNYSQLISDKDAVVVFWEADQPKKNNVLYKFFCLKEEIKKQKFEKLIGLKLNQWILKTIKDIDKKAEISRSGLEQLAIYCQGNTRLIFLEAQKLISYANGKIITEKEVNLLVKAGLENNIFKTIDFLGAGNKKMALQLLHEHLIKGDDPFYLLSMIIYQFRNMLKVSDLNRRNVFSEYEISRETGLHPFVVKKTSAQIRNFSFLKLKKFYQKLVELDRKIKMGEINIILALDEFVAGT